MPIWGPLSDETLAGAGDQAKRALRELFDARLEQHRPSTILRAIGSAIVAVLGLAAIFWVDLRLRRRLASRLERVSPSLTHRVLGHDLRPALFSTGRTLVDAAAWAFRILVVYVALAVVLQQIPYTRPWV